MRDRRRRVPGQRGRLRPVELREPQLRARRANQARGGAAPTRGAGHREDPHLPPHVGVCPAELPVHPGGVPAVAQLAGELLTDNLATLPPHHRHDGLQQQPPVGRKGLDDLFGVVDRALPAVVVELRRVVMDAGPQRRRQRRILQRAGLLPGPHERADPGVADVGGESPQPRPHPLHRRRVLGRGRRRDPHEDLLHAVVGLAAIGQRPREVPPQLRRVLPEQLVEHTAVTVAQARPQRVLIECHATLQKA
ncbi:hypothetical protein OHA72_53120 [Dactylosporangium sp. NBC_01737]|nr:hypothetical protein OHA72_53120 [Dactylosporangium sp. NBC_01737]